MKKKKTFKIILVTVLVVIGLLFLSFLVYFFYPLPRSFWNVWHKNDIAYIDKLSEDLSLSEVLDQRIGCWDINSRCGIISVYLTDRDFNEFEQKVDNLGYEERLSRSIDGHSLVSTILYDTDLDLSVNGETDGLEIHYSTREPFGSKWWLVNEGGKSLMVNFYIPDPEDKYLLDGKELKENVVIVILYTRGR